MTLQSRERKLQIFFSRFEVLRPERDARNMPFSFAIALKFILNDSSVLNVFVFCFGFIHKEITFKTAFLFIDILTERALFKY